VVIIAGGKWTRLWLTDIPKPMVQVSGKPILQWQIELAKRYGLDEIIILSGHLGNVIVDYFGDWSKFGVHIQHMIEELPLGTAWAVKQLESLLTERFFVFYGDTIMDIDLQKMMDFDSIYAESLWTLLVHPNNHPHDSDLVESDRQWLIKAFHSKPHPAWLYYHNLVNAALYILDPRIFSYIESNVSSDFWKHIFPKILQDHKTLRAYKTHEYIKDMWTLERLQQVEYDILSWKVARLNMQNKQKAVFIDRDGVINEEVDNLSHIDDLHILPWTTEGLKIINKSEYLSLLVTNQPMIAKWFLKEAELDEIHKKLESEIGKSWAYIDDIYYCPHHPDKWFEGEIHELKIDCDCRKPKTWMIDQALQEYNIDIAQSFIIGDSTTDIQTGKNAWIKTILVRTWYAGDDGKYNVVPDFVFKDLLEASTFIVDDYDRLYKEVEGLLIKKPKIISIAGLSRSGKSTFTRIFSLYLHDHSVPFQYLNLDNRLLPRDQRSPTMTVRERYQYDNISKDFETLLTGKPIKINTYDVKNRTVKLFTTDFVYDPTSILIIDGVVSLDIPYLRNISDFKIYCDIDEDVRKNRFEEFYIYKWLSDSEITDLYQTRQQDEYHFITQTKQYSDCIIYLN